MIFQLSHNNFKEKLIFPVNPPDYKISAGGTDFNDFKTIKSGEATVIGDKQLQEISFSSFFPRDYDSSICSTDDYPDPWDAVAIINKWRDAAVPSRLVISNTDINILCTIRSFEYEERGGAVGDLWFSISFKAYRNIIIRQVEVKKQVQAPKVVAAPPRVDTQPKAKTYTVVRGDCLWNIAKKFYGNGAQWTKIYNANKSVIGKNPNLIYPGQKYTIPA